MIEQTVQITTRDGICDTFVVHPDRGSPFPAILFYMDGAGVREELRDMARRLASAGYYVMLPNFFYHFNVSDLGPINLDTSSAWYQSILKYSRDLNTAIILSDSAAVFEFADRQEMVKKGLMGCVGYCMTGGYSVSAAAHFSDRIAAAAAFCGTSMVTDNPDSPHLSVQDIKGELYVGWAEKDRFIPQEKITVFAEALSQAGTNAEVETYSGAQHAFMFPQRYSYSKLDAEQHWARLLSLFRRRLA